MIIKVTPNEGYKVLHPDTFHTISTDGENVEHNFYWVQLEKEGSVKISKPDAPENPPTEAEVTEVKN